MKNINEFLNYINGDRSNIIKAHKYVEAINRKSMVKINVQDIAQENQNGDIYFVVNDGSDKNNGITNFNALFIDFDAGRNDNDEYYSLDEVSLFKELIIDKINKYNIKPTFIIGTRNGYHVYWCLKGEITLAEWKLCINKLITYFDSDKQVNNPARLMRLPFTYWMKDKDNPYYVDIIEFNDVKYNIDTILDSLSDVESDSDDLEKNVTDRISIYKHLSICHGKTNTELIKSRNVAELQKRLSPNAIVFQTQQEFYNYITQEIDLYNFLGVYGSSFNCVFHNDNSPSAGIFITERNQFFYKCHSSNCGFRGNIIRCVERLLKCNRPKAINFIKEVYDLSISETDWQKEQKLLLEENKRMIREGELEQDFPEIHKLIKRYKDIIYLLHDIAMDNIYDETYSDDENNVIFFSSLSFIAKELNYKSHGKLPDRLGLLAFLHLIKKLKEDEIPEQYLTKAKHLAAKNKHKNIVNYFSIPSYSDMTLVESLHRANSYVENNISMTGWSRELLQRTFGEEMANEIYPQFKHRKVSKISEIRTSDIHSIIMDALNDKEYVTEKEIIETLRDKYGKNKTLTQIKKSLQEMLDAYGLERIRCNKKIKENFGIVSDGYPFIIIKK